MVRSRYLIFIYIWAVLMNVSCATVDPSPMNVTDWFAKYDKEDQKFLKESYPDGTYQISGETDFNLEPDHKYFFADDKFQNMQNNEIDFSAEIEILKAENIFVELTDIQVWKGYNSSEWIQGNPQKNYDDGSGASVVFGMIIGKNCSDSSGTTLCNWYVIEDWDNANKSQVYLEPKEADYKPGFYHAVTDESQEQAYYDKPENISSKETLTHINHPIYIQEIYEKRDGAQIMIFGKTVDEKWFLIETIGAKTQGTTQARTQRCRNLKLLKETDLLQLETEAADTQNCKKELTDKTAAFDQLNDQLSNQFNDQLNARVQQEADKFKDQIASYESKIWYMEFILGFLSCLIVVSFYLLFYKFKERISGANKSEKGHEFSIGDKVNIRNTKKQEWRLGRVVEVKPTLKVLADGWQKAYEWQFVELFVPSPMTLHKEYPQPEVSLPSPPKEVLPKMAKVMKQQTTPQTIIVHSDDEGINVLHNAEETSQKFASRNSTSTIFDITSADFSSLESTLSDINTSYFTTGFTEELTSQYVSSGSLPTISDATVSSSTKN